MAHREAVRSAPAGPEAPPRGARGRGAGAAQAVDLRDMREVAVKVHQLDPSWTDHRKASYVKHAVRPLPFFICRAVRTPCPPPFPAHCSRWPGAPAHNRTSVQRSHRINQADVRAGAV